MGKFNRFVVQEGEMNLVLNRNLVCATCAFREGELDEPRTVATCWRYGGQKPISVLLGKECPLYTEE